MRKRITVDGVLTIQKSIEHRAQARLRQASLTEKARHVDRNITSSTRKKMSDAKKQHWIDGIYTNVDWVPSKETRSKMSAGSSASKHRRLVKSCRLYTRVDGTTVLLDSSWEEALAKRLDSLNIAWERPINPLEWIDKEGKKRHYFPDFWLPNQGIFLDPKNPIAAKQQHEKVDWLKHNRFDVIFLHSLDDCKHYRV